MRFVLQVQGPQLPIEDWIAATPMVLDQLRALQYDPSGEAIVEGVRTDRLMLVDGRAGQVGSAYRVTDPGVVVERPDSALTETAQAPPLAVTLVADDAERIQIEAHSTGDDDPMGATLELLNPHRPRRLSGVATVNATDLPAFFGPMIELAGEITLADFNFTEEPQIRFDLSSKRISASGTVLLRPTADGYEIVVHARPRGLARLLALGWPIIKKQVIESAQRSISERLVSIDAAHAEIDGPQELADQVWAAMVADLLSEPTRLD